MTSRMTIVLSKEERRALDALARREFRDSRQQVTAMIHQELQRLGLLPADSGAKEVCYE